MRDGSVRDRELSGGKSGVNLATIIDPHPDDATALVAHGRAVTYGELRQATSPRCAAGWPAWASREGDRVALVCGNGSHFAVGYLAIIGLGAICVPLNPASPPAELANQLAHVEAKALLVGPGAGASWAGVDRADVPSVEIVVSAEPDGDATAWDEVAGHEPLGTVELEPDHLAALLFTSGTAGRPQAAMLSHGNLRSNIDQSLSTTDRMRADDVVFGVLPLFHIFGLNVALGITLAAGASVVLVQRFDPSTALDTIAERGVTILPGAPPMWLAWAAMEGIDPGAFANVRQCLTGASKMPEAAARLLAERFGVVLREGYGLTECSPVVTSSASITPKVGSIGVPIEGVEVRLVDPEGDDVLDGDAGEVWVRGPNVFQGYWNDPVTTARVLDADGWLAHGRHRRHRRGRLPLPGRPGQGPDHRVGLQRLPGRGGGRDRAAARRRRRSPWWACPIPTAGRR